MENDNMTKNRNKFVFLAFALLILVIFNSLFSFASLDVNIQDQHTEIIDLKIFEVLNNITIIGTPAMGDRTITIQSIGVVPVQGNILCLKSDDSDAFMQPVALSVTPLGGDQYDIYMDMPLDYPFDNTDGCALGNTNWAVDGSVTPVKFILSPSGNIDGTSWDFTRITFSCLGAGTSTPSDPTPDDTSFFTMDPITNGIYLRVVDGYTKNIFNVKSNHGMKLRVGGDVEIVQTPNKNGFYSTTARRTFNGQDKNGVTIRLDSTTNDTFELVVQDDLTDMELCEAVVQGHIVDYENNDSVNVEDMKMLGIVFLLIAIGACLGYLGNKFINNENKDYKVQYQLIGSLFWCALILVGWILTFIMLLVSEGQTYYEVVRVFFYIYSVVAGLTAGVGFIGISMTLVVMMFIGLFGANRK